MSKRILGVIPARMASSRFPGKPLAEIQGIPMIGHVYMRSKMSPILDDLYVATCDLEIKDYIESVNGKAVMTSETHERASERTAEALEIIEKKLDKKYDIVVMIQGDEPMLRPEMIDSAVRPMIDNNEIQVINLMLPIKSNAEHESVNEVKVVVDNRNYALYFSREPIPSRWKLEENVKKYKQVCIIPFSRDFLLTYNNLPPTPLEIAESVDMLRILEHGYDVKMVLIEDNIFSVDTLEDLSLVDRKMARDDLINRYQKMINSKNEHTPNRKA